MRPTSNDSKTPTDSAQFSSPFNGAARYTDSDGQPTSELNLLLTAEQVARMLQISVQTLWRMRSGRQLPDPVRIGNAVRWRRQEVIQWIDDGCRPPHDGRKGRKRI